MAFGWEGEKVRLTPLDKERHFENAFAWINDPVVTRYLAHGDMPITRLSEEEWFERASKSNESDVLFAIETLDGVHLGFNGIHGINWRWGTAVTGTMIGRQDMWGQGFGSDAALVRTRYAFDVLNLRLLRSEVMAENVGSIKMLTRAGYQEVGRIPQLYWKRGAYRDAVILCALKSEFKDPK